MTDWWTSTKSPRHMFKPSYQTAELEAYLRENTGIDTAILAADLGLHAGHIEAAQRRLGLRKLKGNGRKGCKRIPLPA